MKPIADVVNGILGVKSFRTDIKISTIRSVVYNQSGRSLILEDGSEYNLEGWDENNLDAFHPGGCIITTPEGAETVCSPYFVKNFLL